MNTKIRCIAIDDEPLALELIETFVSNIPSLQLLATFTDALSAIGYIEKTQLDLIFLDIQMPDINGVQLAKSLKHRNPMVIFTTAYSDYAVEGFNLDAIDYLLKPFGYERFSKAIDKVIEYRQFISKPQSRSDSDFIFLRSEYQMIKINIASILYVEGLDDYVRVHLDDNKTVLSLMSMKSLLEKLPAEKFTRIHRSFIVSLAKMQSIRNKKVVVGGVELPIGNAYSDSFLSRIKQ
jgi:DNA-binding LytR/AlgR family response regulator